VIVLALDTATAATVAAVQVGEGPAVEARDDPAPGSRPNHAARLLALAEQALGAAGVGWQDLDRVAVGVGPGSFTGLRIGVSTARALAQSHAIPLVAVSTLRALALAATPERDPRPVLAVIDARRGEAFAAAWSGGGEPLLPPSAYPPEALARRAAGLSAALLAVGDGAIRFRPELESAGLSVPADDSALHRVQGASLCRLGVAGEPVDREALLPDYLREPDAKPPRPL
jgi:tRNA threonylcarbamoyladenosine biosynthesis protein TsaB